MNAIPPCVDQMPRCLDAVHDAICTQPQNRQVPLTVAQWWEVFGFIEGLRAARSKQKQYVNVSS